MEYGSEVRKGLSKKGEDRVVTMPDIGLFAVFDGHNGQQASEFVARELPQNLRKLLEQRQEKHTTEELTKALLTSAIEMTERDFLTHAESSGIQAGTTACVAMVTNEVVVVANVGDSRAIAFQASSNNNGMEAVELSQDHKPKIASERARIEAAGGKVVFDGVSYRLKGGLGLSRALGDKDFKRREGLSAEAEFRVWALPPSCCRPCFLVLASDGAFEKLSIKAIAEIINSSKHETAQCIATKIVERGVRVDDISVILVKWLSDVA